MKRKLFVALTGTLLAMMIAGGVALAADVRCDRGTRVEGGWWCFGTSGADTMTGTDKEDRMEAKAGNDKLYGLGNTDALYGGAGDDELHGDAYPSGATASGANWDALFGGLGSDKLYAEGPGGEAGVDVLNAGKDDKPDWLYGGPGQDVYVVDKASYRAGVDVIRDDQTLGAGVPLPSDDRPHVLRQRALEGGPHLYFYP